MPTREIRHPLIRHKIGLMRRADISTKNFRELAQEVGALLTYEATNDLPLETYDIEGWAGTVQVENVAPSLLVSEACATIRERADRHKVTLETPPGTAQSVAVDRVQIEAVLHNLLTNAVDALDARSDGRVVRVTSARDGPGFVRIAVEDNGPGIAPEIADALFDPFVTTKAAGTGLGLAISRSIVDAHGGRLWHEALATGNAFCFTVPEAQ